MKRNHIFTAVLLTLLLTLAVSACAAAAEIRPIPLDHDTLDLGNGEFRLTARSTWQVTSGGYFIAVLYLPDRYEGEQIRSLAPGDTVLANDQAWTVKEIHPHPAEGAPEEDTEYEIYPEEELDGYLVFVPCGDGTYMSLMNDWNPITLAGSVKVMLPLPDDFAYICDDETMNADEFIDDLELFGADDGMTPYNTSCEFRDGQLIRVVSADYPYGPEEDDDAEFKGVPVWKFCHGFRDGLDTAIITAYSTDCEEGLLPVEITPEETEEIRCLAMNGRIKDKANDDSITGGTWVYSFETPGGKHLLSIELYKGLIVASDGMYAFEK